MGCGGLFPKVDDCSGRRKSTPSLHTQRTFTPQLFTVDTPHENVENHITIKNTNIYMGSFGIHLTRFPQETGATGGTDPELMHVAADVCPV